MRKKRRRRNIAKRPQQREPGQIDTPRWLRWTEALTKIINAVVAIITAISTLIKHWPW